MLDLNALALFAKVAEAGSFSEAARRLKRPVSTVSRRIADLEDALGVQLLERSTRKLRLTVLGTELLEEARRTVDVGESVEGIISDQFASVSGKLRIAAPPNLSDSLLGPTVVSFQEEHPDIRIEIMVTERYVDPIAEQVDLAFHVGPLEDAGMVSRRILQFRHQLVASPAYLARVDPPRQPRDLLDHRILAFSHFRPDYEWSFRHVNGRDRDTISFRPALGVNDFTGVTTALLSGVGIGDLSPIVQPTLMREGRLVEVMPDWHFPLFDLSLIHLGHRHLPRSVRAFKDFAADMAQRLFPALPI